MQLSVPNKGQVISFGRHVVSYSAGAVSAAVMLHVISGDQGQGITGAITQISTGIASIAAGVATLTSIGMGIWAAFKSSPFATLLQASKVLGNQGMIVVKDPALAAALPANVVAATAATPNTSGKGPV